MATLTSSPKIVGSQLTAAKSQTVSRKIAEKKIENKLNGKVEKVEQRKIARMECGRCTASAPTLTLTLASHSRSGQYK